MEKQNDFESLSHVNFDKLADLIKIREHFGELSRLHV